MTVIIDYGVGNLFSLASSLRFLGVDVCVSAKEHDIRAAERIVLPGVGAFGDAMQKLEATGIVPVLREEVANGTPILGICLGMQLLFEESHEFGIHKGLGFLKGTVCPLEPDLAMMGLDYKVPHIGWNALHLTRPELPLLANTMEGDYVYYVHSFYAKQCAESIAATSEYGVQVPGVVGKDNVYGCQFHPEKSGRVGLAILAAFADL